MEIHGVKYLQIPKVMDGEAAFAASNTNILIKGNNTWFVSGGKKIEFFIHEQGSFMDSFDNCSRKSDKFFTADFYDSKIGFIAGGDYELRNQNFSNKALTDAEKHGISLQKVLGMPLVCNMFLKVTVKD
jgi:hypothetical protein